MDNKAWHVTGFWREFKTIAKSQKKKNLAALTCVTEERKYVLISLGFMFSWSISNITVMTDKDSVSLNLYLRVYFPAAIQLSNSGGIMLRPVLSR